MRLLPLLALFISACASLPPVPPAEASVAQCLVCRCRRDFDCLEVDKSPRTPHADFAGRTYYFCGENCRKEFERNPGRYTR